MSVDSPAASRMPSQPPTVVRRPGKPAHPLTSDAFFAICGLGLGATLALFLTSESLGALRAPGGLLTAAGRICGLVGTYLILVMILLIARIPAIERALGQDRLLTWHRRLGPYPIYLLMAHAVFVTLGYAAADRSGIWHEIRTLLLSYPDVLAAVVGLGLLIMAGATSVRIARRRLRYETWWAVHLYIYLALALSFTHQIVTGASFVGHPLARIVWSVVWASTAGLVLLWRFGLPVVRSLRHQLRVVAVQPEGPGIVSIICSGRRLDRLAVSGGQFFQWRFLTRGLWWHAHPYSLSALPRPPYLRITIKGLGDQSGEISRLTPGTRVAIEGPYGIFTHHARLNDRALLVAAGVGVTPIRAMLEDFPRQVDVVVVLRARSVEDTVLRSEIETLVRDRGGRLIDLTGSRKETRIEARALLRLVPDVAARDLYVCGPPAFSEEVVAAGRAIGLRPEAIHHEVFSF